ncbi:MAG TPA: nitrilase-related carbon-nitrogen hydrolase [Nitrospiria bacterium]|nr:nitrilase-related carbon-nitrogen hydrolase [Nitrospiria bacterium]
MDIGFVQNSTIFGRVKTNLDRISDLVASVRADVLVLPELFATGYQFTSQREAERLSEPVPDGVTTKRLITLAKRRKCVMVAGLAERKGRSLYNSAVVVGPNGLIGLYRKSHLFYEETLWFTPGNTGFRVFQAGGAVLGVMICFDWFFPESTRLLSLAGADVICHPSNLVLPHAPNAMKTRCLENRVFAVTADRVGFEERGERERLTFIGSSQVVSPQGEVLVRASTDREEVHVVTIDPKDARRKTINRYNHLFADRRPELYSGLATPLAEPLPQGPTPSVRTRRVAKRPRPSGR